MELHLHRFDLPLRDPFQITHETRTVQPSLVVELRDGALRGLGEATETRYYGIHRPEMVQTLERLRPVIEATPLAGPEAWWTTLHQHLAERPFELCALDVAANDLAAQRAGQPLYQYWGLSLTNLPLTNYTIGMASIEDMRRKIRERPWPLYKIKLGTDHDLDIVRALREETSSPFRIDANTGWTAAKTLELAPRLRELGVEFIEQPLPPEDVEGMRAVFARSVLPVMADESCHVEADVDRCHGLFHGINIKLMKCGGLTPARRMIDRARQLGMRVMVGCMTESSVGISAIAHLLPRLDYVDMDGALLLREDIAEGVTIEDGRVEFADRAGTGARLLEF